MKTTIECCRQCTDGRHVGCHATCKAYIDEVAEMHKAKEAYKTRAELQQFIMESQINRFDRRVKYLKRRGKR